MWVIVVFRLFLLECHEHIIAEKSYRCVTDFALTKGKRNDMKDI